MLPAGSTSEHDERLVLRPIVQKTFIKGVIAVALFSIFLQISPATLVNYFIFLGLTLGSLVIFCLAKGRSRYLIDEEGIHIKRLLQRPSMITYDNIHDMSVSQGMLATRFNCGTVFFILNRGPGSVRIMGGGVAEKLDDVRDPKHVYDLVSSKLGPFGQSS